MDNQSNTRSFEPLSQREREILALLAEGLSDRGIAARLVLARTTIKWYNRQIFNKLGVENRQQAVEQAFALGLLSSAQPVLPSPLNLPSPLTPFVGRVSELDDLTRLLSDPDVRLVTILAPGGMGKTRLAIAAVQAMPGQFADGVPFVPCAPLTLSDHLVPTIADAIGFPFFADARAPKEQLLDFLRTKHVLLLLDNFEHLLDSAALVADILQAAPQVKVLVTSRERLNLDGETVYSLGGMPYPAPGSEENTLDYSAVQLFVECARRANPHFSAEDRTSMVEVCQLVQGMPLALELAAAWAGMLTPAEIAAEIARNADFLRSTKSNVPERLRSVRAVFEATWQRLSDPERQAFRRLSVFRGGCTREAAQMVTEADLAALAGLVDKALLWHNMGRGRYEVHELLRQYAAEQLVTAGEAEMVSQAHCDYFGALAQRWGLALKTPQQLEALDRLEADADNLRKAFRRATESGKPDIIEPFTALWYYYEIRARYTEAEETFGKAIEKLAGQESLTLGKLLAGQSLFVGRLDQWEQSRVYATKSIDLLRRVGAEHETPMPLMQLGNTFGWFGDLESEETLWRETLEVAQRYEDQWAVAVSLYLLGASAGYHQRLSEAKNFYTQSYALTTRLGNHWLAGFVLRDLAYVFFEEENYDEAGRLFSVGLAGAQKVHHLMNVSAGFSGLRAVALAKGELLQARHFAEDALNIERELGSNVRLCLARAGLVEVVIASGDIPESRQQLREILRALQSIDEQDKVIFLGVAVAPFLVLVDAKADAVNLLSFLQHDPRWELLPESIKKRLRILSEQIQSELPAHTYTNAWEAGRTVSLNDLLAKLHVLI